MTIIIVNWNGALQLNDCIQSINHVRQDCLTISEVIIVDNNSSDDSLRRINHTNIKIRFIKNEVNLGFSKACNQGAAHSRSNYLLFLNPDTRLFENSLNLPVSFLHNPSNANIGICGIQLVDENGIVTTSAARFPSLRVMAGKILGLSKFFPNLFPSHLMTNLEDHKDGEVDQIIGAFFLIRRDLFEMCGGFDERFFVYFEEVDLSLRAKQLGYSSYLLSGTSAFHQGGGCSNQIKALRLFYSLRSRLQYANKHYSKIDFAALILLTGAEFFLRIILGLLNASVIEIKNTLIGYYLLIIYIFRGIKWPF